MKLRSNAEVERLVEECVRLQEEQAAGEPVARARPSASGVVREAIELYHRHTVLGQTIVAPDDPRFEFR